MKIKGGAPVLLYIWLLGYMICFAKGWTICGAVTPDEFDCWSWFPLNFVFIAGFELSGMSLWLFDVKMFDLMSLSLAEYTQSRSEPLPTLFSWAWSCAFSEQYFYKLFVLEQPKPLLLVKKSGAWVSTNTSTNLNASSFSLHLVVVVVIQPSRWP